MDEGEKPLSCAASEEPHTKDGAKHTQSYLPMELRGAESGSGADKFCIREGKVGPGTKLASGACLGELFGHNTVGWRQQT